MKICPKCQGRYFDDMRYCSECFGGNIIQLVTKEEFTNKTGKGFETLTKINLEQEIKDKEYEQKHPRKQRDYRSYYKQKTENQHVPKCPTCGSTNVRPISGLNRAGSVFAFGLFSSKIGKTYECLNCKYKW